MVKANLFNMTSKAPGDIPTCFSYQTSFKHTSHCWTRIHTFPGMCSFWLLRSSRCFLSSKSALHSPYPSQFSCVITAHHSWLMAPSTERHTPSIHHQNTSHYNASLSSSAMWTLSIDAELHEGTVAEMSALVPPRSSTSFYSTHYLLNRSMNWTPWSL